MINKAEWNTSGPSSNPTAIVSRFLVGSRHFYSLRLNLRTDTTFNLNKLTNTSPTWSSFLSTTQKGILEKVQTRACKIILTSDTSFRISNHHLNFVWQFGKLLNHPYLPPEIPCPWAAVLQFVQTTARTALSQPFWTSIISTLPLQFLHKDSVNPTPLFIPPTVYILCIISIFSIFDCN